MRFWWPRASGWVLLLGSALLGVGCGIGIGYLLSSRVAGAAVGVVTTIVGLVGVKGLSVLDRRAERRAAVPGNVLSGRLTRVSDLTDPIVLGVHPAAANDSGRVPPYIMRDIDAELEDAIRTGGFIMVSGESTAGKSRAAFEIMRRVLPGHKVIAPAGRQSVQMMVDVALEQRRCVFWLDDIERFFGAGGLAVPAISRLLGGRWSSSARFVSLNWTVSAPGVRRRWMCRRPTVGGRRERYWTWPLKSSCRAYGAEPNWHEPSRLWPTSGFVPRYP
jgi:eukaryotic-like serine/threonine-protein kinase